MNNTKTKYGWMSREQGIAMERSIHINKKFGGAYKIYLNEKGEEVMVTAISDTEDHGCNFSDMTFVGMVKEHVRSQHSI
tara:strand:- start:913 stop:1149 length:237 start_codon:yes stop_codon:yes gene_type:complete